VLFFLAANVEKVQYLLHEIQYGERAAWGEVFCFVGFAELAETIFMFMFDLMVRESKEASKSRIFPRFT
jgi:hypothetical protein